PTVHPEALEGPAKPSSLAINEMPERGPTISSPANPVILSLSKGRSPKADPSVSLPKCPHPIHKFIPTP
ncbi:MAG: hypothetical protein ABI559_12765, partial [Chloroflexota bacterium]